MWHENTYPTARESQRKSQERGARLSSVDLGFDKPGMTAIAPEGTDDLRIEFFYPFVGAETVTSPDVIAQRLRELLQAFHFEAETVDTLVVGTDPDAGADNRTYTVTLTGEQMDRMSGWGFTLTLSALDAIWHGTTIGGRFKKSIYTD